MIIVKLTGGLGNQMFQYAAARRLADLRETVLKLDLTILQSIQSDRTPRAYELKNLNISAAIATPQEIADITGLETSWRKSILRRFNRMLDMKKARPRIIRERHFHFDPEILNTPDNSYLEGYWQSERYFMDVSDLLQKEFTFKLPLSGANLTLAQEIEAVNSISLHVRRGDYVSNKVVINKHGVCSLDYYRCCVANLIDKVADPHFYIFSDDPEWVRENISLPFKVTFVRNNGIDKGYEDLRLMSLCRHNIIANSTLSWWGAWLNMNPGKIVFAPQNWFADTSIDTSDLIPEKWIKL